MKSAYHYYNLCYLLPTARYYYTVQNNKYLFSNLENKRFGVVNKKYVALVIFLLKDIPNLIIQLVMRTSALFI